MTPLPPLPPCWIVLCKPLFSLSTPALYRAWDKARPKLRPDTQGLIQGLEQGDLTAVAQRLFNVFEHTLSPRQRREVEAIKVALVQAGALGAAMSGSGPTVFGLFDQEVAAQDAVTLLKESYPEVFLTRPIASPEEIPV